MKRPLELALFIVGVASISFGVWSIYRPAGYIVVGLLLMLAAAFSRSGPR